MSNINKINHFKEDALKITKQMMNTVQEVKVYQKEWKKQEFLGGNKWIISEPQIKRWGNGTGGPVCEDVGLKVWI